MSEPKESSEERKLPYNLEAEQAILGAILLSNEVLDRVSGLLEPHHFFHPLHSKLYEVAHRKIQRGQLVTVITLKTHFTDDPQFEEVGGQAYLAQLATSAVSAVSARDFAEIIYDLSVRRSLMQIGDEISYEASQPGLDVDPKEQIVQAEQKLYHLAEQGKYEGGFKSFVRAATEAVQVANAAYQRDGGLAGIATNLTEMDRKLGGLHNSDLLILAGRPSMGKTSLATNIAFNIAKDWRQGERADGTTGTIDGGVVGFFSLEMSAEQLATRVLSEQAMIPSEKIRRGDLSEDEFRRFIEAARDLERIPLYIDDTPALPIATLAARARRLKRQHGLDLLVVDYLQLLRGSAGRGGDNRVQEVSDITQGLKAIAKELNIPVIALSQLSRQVESREDKRPQLSDLRESGSIEQDADVVMFVYREEYYLSRTEPREGTPEHLTWLEEMEKVQNLAEVIVGKQRHGPIGTIRLMFDSRYTKFTNLANDPRAQQYG